MAKPWKTRDYHVLLSDGTTKQAYAESQEQAETYVRRHLERIGDGRTVIPSGSGAGADSGNTASAGLPASPGYNARATKEGSSMSSKGTYGYDNLWISEGDRVEISPATDLWMMGDRYGTVVSIPRSALEVMDERHVRIKVRMDKSGRVVTGSGQTFRSVTS